MSREYHTFAPVWDFKIRILILGSFPSVKSREVGFYYAHKQNRFWRVLSEIFEEEIKEDTVSKTNFLLNHNIALWDVINSCDITGSADTNIKNIDINDIKSIIEQSSIKHIYTNGKLAYNLYEKYVYPLTDIHSHYLPSTSPANAAFGLDRLKASWEVIKQS